MKGEKMMMILEDYLMNERMVGFTEVFGEEDEKWTRVIEGEDELIVRMAPRKVIAHTLENLGFSLPGAICGSKRLLGKDGRMHPLTINDQLGIYLLPTKAYDRHDCFWLSVQHIIKIEAIGDDSIRVYMNYGHTLDLDMKETLFRKKLDKAKRLWETVGRNSRNPETSCPDPKTGFRIVEKDGEYRLKK